MVISNELWVCWMHNWHSGTYIFPITFNTVLAVVTGATNGENTGNSSGTNASQRFCSSIAALTNGYTTSQIWMKTDYENVAYNFIIIGY